MPTTSTPAGFPLKRLLHALLLACLCLAGTVPAAAEVPTTTPVFSDPLTIDNPYAPVSPGAVKVFVGREGSRRVTIVENHLDETRSFEWDGGTVECRVVTELKWVTGKARLDGRRYLAQADDGSVWTFGETDDEDGEDDDDDDDEDDDGGWIVGVAVPSDPVGVDSTANPALLMPAQPERGDLWLVEDTPPAFVEYATVTGTRSRVRIPAGRFTDCLRTRQFYPGAQRRRGEQLWHAPGIGFVRKVHGRDRVSLHATSLRRSRR